MPDLYIFDVDGTLIRSFLRDGAPVEDYDRVEFLDGRVGRINGLKMRPQTHFAIATNQGGVAMGYQESGQVWLKMGQVVAGLGLWDVPTSVHVAFNHPQARLEQYKKDDGMRKPGPGMLLQAARAHGASKPDTIFVGDRDTDRQAANAAGIRYMDAEEFFGAG